MEASDPSHSGVPALVLGGGVSALAALRALGRAGVPCHVVGDRSDLVARSRWYRPAPGPALAQSPDPEPLARWLERCPLPRAVLFPCTDEWALAVAGLPGEVTQAYPGTVAPASVLRLLVDKGLFAETVAELGVPTPRTIRVAGLDDLDALGDEELPGFFVKPRSSQAFHARFGVKARRLEDRATARRILGQVLEDGHEVLLQRYVEGPPSGHVFLDGYVDRSGAMRACLARRRVRLHPPDFGNSTMSVTISLEEAAEALEGLRRLFEGIAYVGLFDAEFVHDPADGRLKVLEVNARPWWQLELAWASGLELVLMAYRDALGLPLPPAGPYRVGQTWVHPLLDLRAWWSARGSGAVSGGPPLGRWLRGANAVFSRDDPLPAADELQRVARRLAGAALRRS